MTKKFSIATRTSILLVLSLLAMILIILQSGYSTYVIQQLTREREVVPNGVPNTLTDLSMHLFEQLALARSAVDLIRIHEKTNDKADLSLYAEQLNLIATDIDKKSAATMKFLQDYFLTEISESEKKATEQLINDYKDLNERLVQLIRGDTTLAQRGQFSHQIESIHAAYASLNLQILDLALLGQQKTRSFHRVGDDSNGNYLYIMIALSALFFLILLVQAWLSTNIKNQINKILGLSPELLVRKLNSIANTVTKVKFAEEKKPFLNANDCVSIIQGNINKIQTLSKQLQLAVTDRESYSSEKVIDQTGHLTTIVETLQYTLNFVLLTIPSERSPVYNHDQEAVLNKREFEELVSELEKISEAMKSEDTQLRLSTHGQSIEMQKIGDCLNSLLDTCESVLTRIKNTSQSISDISRELNEAYLHEPKIKETINESLMQTTSCMQKLSTDLESTKESAAKANIRATELSISVRDGGRSLQEVANHIALVNLNTLKIDSMISILDSIAAQGDMLGINAAMEAARVGEQGHGFSVVASEVRSLSQRSNAATKEIRDLILDSIAKSNHGNILLDHIKQTIEETLETVIEFSKMTAHLATESNDHVTSINVMNQSVSDLDSAMKTQNKLLEQTAIFSSALAEKAQSLSESLIKLKETEESPPQSDISDQDVSASHDEENLNSRMGMNQDLIRLMMRREKLSEVVQQPKKTNTPDVVTQSGVHKAFNSPTSKKDPAPTDPDWALF